MGIHKCQYSGTLSRDDLLVVGEVHAKLPSRFGFWSLRAIEAGEKPALELWAGLRFTGAERGGLFGRPGCGAEFSPEFFPLEV